MGYNSKELRVSKDPKKPSKPKDTDYVSKMGYRDDSPFRNQEAINIYTPNGTIDMSNTGIPLMANGRYLPPYSGQHQFDTTNVLEQRMASGGEVDADKAYSFLLAKSIYGHPLSAAQTKAFARIAGVKIDANGDIIEEGEEGDDESVSYDDEDSGDMSYEKRGGSTRGKRTSKNIKTSVNKLLQRNAMLYGPSGKNLYDPKYKTGGWLDEYQDGGTVAELWQEVTGTPWKEAAARGLTDGSYEMNMQLKKLLLNENPQALASRPKAAPSAAPVRQQVPAKVQQAPMPRINPSLMGAPNYRSESVQSQRGDLENPIERANAPVHAARIEKEKEDKRRERLIEQQKMDLAKGQGKKLWDIDYEMRKDKAIEEHQKKIQDYTNLTMTGVAALGTGLGLMEIPYVAGAANAAMIGHGAIQAPETYRAWTDPTISKEKAFGLTLLNAMDFAGVGSPLKAIAESTELRNVMTRPFDAMGQKILREYKPEVFATPGVIGAEEIQLNRAARKFGTRWNELNNPEYLAKLRREGYRKVGDTDMAARELWNRKAQLLKEANLTDKELAGYKRTRQEVEDDYLESLRVPAVQPERALTEIELAKKSKNKNFYPKEEPLDLKNRGMQDLSKTEIKNVMIDRGANPLLTTAKIPGPTTTTMDKVKTWSQNKMADLVRKNVLKPTFERNYMPLATKEQQILAEHNKVLNKLFGDQRANPMQDIDAVKAFIKEQPKGYAFMGSGSLSDSSFPLYTMHAQRGIMANEIKPVFTGYAGLNEEGHLFKYGAKPELRADFLNKSIEDFNISMRGKYKLPPAYVDNGVVMYPQMSLIKKELGGQSMPYVHYQLGGGWLDQYQTAGATGQEKDQYFDEKARLAHQKMMEGIATDAYDEFAYGESPMSKDEQRKAGELSLGFNNLGDPYTYANAINNYTGRNTIPFTTRERPLPVNDIYGKTSRQIGNINDQSSGAYDNSGRPDSKKLLNSDLKPVQPAAKIVDPYADFTWKFGGWLDEYQPGGPVWQDEGSKNLKLEIPKTGLIDRSLMGQPNFASETVQGQAPMSKYAAAEQNKAAVKSAIEGRAETVYNQNLQRQDLKKKYPTKNQEEIQRIQDKIESPLFYEPVGQLASYATRFHGLTDDELARITGSGTMGDRLGVAANMGAWALGNEIGAKAIGNFASNVSPYIEKGLGYVGGKLNKFLPKNTSPLVGKQLQKLEAVPPPPTYEQYAASNLDPVTRDVYEGVNPVAQSSRTAAPVQPANTFDLNSVRPTYNNRNVKIPSEFKDESKALSWYDAKEHNMGDNPAAYIDRALRNTYGPEHGTPALEASVDSGARSALEGYNRVHNAIRRESNNFRNWTRIGDNSYMGESATTAYQPEIASIKEIKNIDKTVIDKVDKYMQRPINATGTQNYDTHAILGDVKKVTSTSSIPKTEDIPDLITSFEKVYEKVKGKNTDLEKKLRIQLEDLRGTNWLRTTGKAELEAQGLKPKELSIIDTGAGQYKNLVDKEGNIVGTVTLSGTSSPVVHATGVNYKFHGYKLKDANAVKEAEAQLSERLLKDKATREALAEQSNYQDPWNTRQDWSQGVYDELMSPEYSNLYKPEAEKTLAQLLDNNQNRYGDMLYRGVHHGIKDTRGPLTSHAHFVQTTLPDVLTKEPKTLYRGQNYWESGIKRGTHQLTPDGLLQVVRKLGGEGWLDNY